jgi:hypothetical protein
LAGSLPIPKQDFVLLPADDFFLGWFSPTPGHKKMSSVGNQSEMHGRVVSAYVAVLGTGISIFVADIRAIRIVTGVWIIPMNIDPIFWGIVCIVPFIIVYEIANMSFGSRHKSIRVRLPMPGCTGWNRCGRVFREITVVNIFVVRIKC